jgi:hypothetical protein
MRVVALASALVCALLPSTSARADECREVYKSLVPTLDSVQKQLRQTPVVTDDRSSARAIESIARSLPPRTTNTETYCDQARKYAAEFALLRCAPELASRLLSGLQDADSQLLSRASNHWPSLQRQASADDSSAWTLCTANASMGRSPSGSDFELDRCLAEGSPPSTSVMAGGVAWTCEAVAPPTKPTPPTNPSAAPDVAAACAAQARTFYAAHGEIWHFIAGQHEEHDVISHESLRAAIEQSKNVGDQPSDEAWDNPSVPACQELLVMYLQAHTVSCRASAARDEFERFRPRSDALIAKVEQLRPLVEASWRPVRLEGASTGSALHCPRAEVSLVCEVGSDEVVKLPEQNLACTLVDDQKGEATRLTIDDNMSLIPVSDVRWRQRALIWSSGATLVAATALLTTSLATSIRVDHLDGELKSLCRGEAGCPADSDYLSKIERAHSLQTAGRVGLGVGIPLLVLGATGLVLWILDRPHPTKAAQHGLFDESGFPFGTKVRF